MNIPTAIQESVLKLLKLEPSAASIQSFTPASGGCINNGGKLSTSSGNYFLKWNSSMRFPGMFAAEARGLKLLRNSKSIYIPGVIGSGENGEYQFLLLEYIDQPSAFTKSHWIDFGNRLAQLHKTTSLLFGLDHNNYIGSLVQSNKTSTSWIEFFIHQRLNVQLQLAVKTGAAPSALFQSFETLYTKLPSLFPEEKPSLLHGDLWSGNLLMHLSGSPCLIDPAVYFGHREMDLAMTQLFGSFDNSFLNAYGEVFPLQPGFHERIDLYNLYPLLVHVNLFGDGYLSSVNSILRRFI